MNRSGQIEFQKQICLGLLHDRADSHRHIGFLGLAGSPVNYARIPTVGEFRARQSLGWI